MLIYGIDPGPKESALVVIDESYAVERYHYGPNVGIEAMLTLAKGTEDHLACEFIQSYGMAVGKNTFFTCLAVGRFQAMWAADKRSFLYSRPSIKGHLVQGVKGVKDKHIRNSLRQRFGLSKKGHPLEGISRHKWDALAVAVTHLDCLNYGKEEFLEF